MNKIYEIELDSDYGKIWLDDEFKPLKYIHQNDMHEAARLYKSWGNKAFEIIEEYATDLLGEEGYNKMLDAEPDCAEMFCEFFVPKLKEKYK